ncbi:meiotic recombination protein REC114 [Cyrtonyx montezumae]|uniref:meiotic recombination protein REC114 n=1 Tax=Cyrtonyx montezumae TaxID=9017 RepID=UPI0032DBE074
MAACRSRSRCPSQRGRSSCEAAEQPSGGSSLLASSAIWPLKRYGRFLPPEDCEQSSDSWKVFESHEESGHLTLTIVVSGHFFISQGRTVLEGFSLIDAQKWLRIVRRADCLLLHAQSKNECRIFRVQFGGDSEEQALEHCCSCVQKLTEYVPVHGADEQSQNLCYSLSTVEDTEQNTSELRADELLPDSCTNFGERRSTMQLAESVLKQKAELPLLYRHAVCSARELGPFIRLCLMDQHFPAFVEDVERELKKLTEG